MDILNKIRSKIGQLALLIDPEKTKIKKATFALDGLKGLLYKHNIIVE